MKNQSLANFFSISLLVLSANFSNMTYAATETCINYSHTGAPETLLLPPKITEIRVTVTGADGGDAAANNGGSGATVSGTLAVGNTEVIDVGDTITVIVGQVGQDGDVSTPVAESQVEAGGGGGTGVVFSTTALFVAGAGGGGDNTGQGGGATAPVGTGESAGTTGGTATTGGAGGTGGNGGGGGDDSPKPGNGGGGGFNSDGGTGIALQGAATGGGACISGGLPSGGVGGSPANEELGNGTTGQLGVAGGYGCGGGGGAGHRESGGGGGYNGGGAGGASGNPGGGGSFVNPSATNVSNSSGIDSGGSKANGSAQICYDVPDADLSITKTDNATSYTPGESFSYTITVTNFGPDEAGGTLVSDAFGNWMKNAAETGPSTWTCSATNGAICPNLSGIGSINETIDVFPAPSGILNATVTYTINGTFSSNMADYL